MTNSRDPPDRICRMADEPTARRRQARRGEEHSGKANVTAEPHFAVDLRRRVEALQRLADEAALRGLLQPWRPWRRSARRFFGKLSKAEGAHTVDDIAVGGFAFRLGDVPPVGGRADQHRASDRRRMSQCLLECANRGRAGGNSHRSAAFDAPGTETAEMFQPALLPGHRIGIVAGERRGLDRDCLPCGAELVGDDLRKRGPYALSGFRLGHRDRYPAIARDFDEIAEGLFGGARAKIASELPGPQSIADHQPDARAASDQQRAAIELQRAY